MSGGQNLSTLFEEIIQNDSVGKSFNIFSLRKKFKGSVISMSLGGEYSETQNNLVNEIVKWGVTIVTASGNDGKDACLNSPGSAGLNINVGAHWYKADGSTKCTKPMYARSNYGKCVSIVAPGVDVLSASIEGKKSKCNICVL